MSEYLGEFREETSEFKTDPISGKITHLKGFRQDLWMFDGENKAIISYEWIISLILPNGVEAYEELDIE